MRPSPARSMPPPRTADPAWAVDFANTVSCPACRAGDALADESAFARWRRSRPELPREANGRLASMRAAREDLRTLFRAQVEGVPPPPVALRRVNALAREYPRPSGAVYRAGRFSPAPAATDRIDLGAIFARAAIALLTGPSAERVIACQAPGCAHFLLARTRTQRWCSPSGCGNRARVARHYERWRASGGSRPAPRRGRRSGRPGPRTPR